MLYIKFANEDISFGPQLHMNARPETAMSSRDPRVSGKT